MLQHVLIVAHPVAASLGLALIIGAAVGMLDLVAHYLERYL